MGKIVYKLGDFESDGVPAGRVQDDDVAPNLFTWTDAKNPGVTFKATLRESMLMVVNHWAVPTHTSDKE